MRVMYNDGVDVDVDVHICEQFPVLRIFNIYDLTEGTMKYHGGLSIDEITDKLNRLGFQTEINKE